MKGQKRNAINRHNSSYDRATEYALRAIYDDVIIKFQGQEFSYDKQRNELKVQDFYNPASIYQPEFKNFMGNEICNPFAKLIRQEMNDGN